MSTRVGGIEMFAEPFRPNLESLVRNLDRDAARSKRLIRGLLDEDRGRFLKLALPILKANLESAGAQYIVGVLCGAGLLVDALVHPELTREQALAVAQTAGRVDSNVEPVLARALADHAGEAEAAERVEEQTRLMEILNVISDGSRILPTLVRLLQHPNAHIRSKAVLMIGRGKRSANWVRQRLGNSDPRIRANAAEALWGIDTPEARELLESLAHDSNNRVAGNALVGLYRLGDQSVIPEILALARHDSPVVRATAAWVIQASGDPRFTEVLAALLREPHGVVRKRAFAALGSIRAAVAQAHQGPRWRLFARVLDAEPGRAGRRVAFGVMREDGGAAPPLSPTQLLLSEDGQNIAQYRVVERPLPETMPVVFVLPQSAAGEARVCLRLKRPGDLWALLYYNPEVSHAKAAVEGPLRFHSSREAIEAELEGAPAAIERGDLWRAVARAVKVDSGSNAGKRRILIFHEPAERPAADEELVGMANASQAFVQAISRGPDRAVQDFCRRAGGLYHPAGEGAGVEAYLNLLTRYEASYQPLRPEAKSLKLRLHGPGLYAETCVRLRA